MMIEFLINRHNKHQIRFSNLQKGSQYEAGNMGLTEELNICYCHQLFETWALLVGHDILAESRLMNKAQIFSYMATLHDVAIRKAGKP